MHVCVLSSKHACMRRGIQTHVYASTHSTNTDWIKFYSLGLFEFIVSGLGRVCIRRMNANVMLWVIRVQAVRV